jgi:hypothetical protein
MSKIQYLLPCFRSLSNLAYGSPECDAVYFGGNLQTDIPLLLFELLTTQRRDFCSSLQINLLFHVAGDGACVFLSKASKFQPEHRK